jgi:hypothetical protein
VDDSRQGRIGRTQVEELGGRGAAMELPSARATGMCTSAPSLAFLSAGHRLRPPPPQPLQPPHPTTHTYIHHLQELSMHDMFHVFASAGTKRAQVPHWQRRAIGCTRWLYMPNDSCRTDVFK